MQRNKFANNSQFDIKFQFDESVSRQQRKVFQEAANSWEKVIKGDLPDVTSHLFNSTVDDLIIGTTVSRIDGAGGTLGAAAPQEFRVDSLLPASGFMKFDTADIPDEPKNNGQFYDTVLHEMGHVLGIGAGLKWEQLLNDNILWRNPRFEGEQTTAAVNEIFGLNMDSVPIEEEGGRGTAFAHLDEKIFQNELMTGYLDSGQNSLSKITVALLDDLGYSVNPNAADNYHPPDNLLA